MELEEVKQVLPFDHHFDGDENIQDSDDSFTLDTDNVPSEHSILARASRFCI